MIGGWFLPKYVRILTRYHAALKARESSNSKDLPAAEAKAEQLKMQYEDEMMKFEAAKV